MDASIGVTINLIISTLGTCVIAWIGYKMKKLEHSMNSMREELVLTTAKASKAEGKLEGKAEEKADQAGVTLLAPRPDA